MDLQTVMLQEAHKAYPSHEEVDQWAARLLKQSEEVAIHAEFVDYCPITVSFGNSPNTLVNKYVKFMASDGRKTFYGYWQPAIRTPAPLLINLPGYGSSISMHPIRAFMFCISLRWDILSRTEFIRKCSSPMETGRFLTTPPAVLRGDMRIGCQIAF